MSKPPRSSQLLGKVLFGSLPLFTFGLGVWQTYRYFQIKPASSTEEEENDPNRIFVRASDLDLTQPLLLGPRKWKSDSREYGYFVFAPSQKDSLLVCLGWLPKQDARVGGKPQFQITEERIKVHVGTGEERGNFFSPPTPSQDGSFLWANKPALLLAAGLDPNTARLGETYDKISNELLPKIKPEPYLNKWTHAGYATTWYSLTLAGVFMMRKMFA